MNERRREPDAEGSDQSSKNGPVVKQEVFDDLVRRYSESAETETLKPEEMLDGSVDAFNALLSKVIGGATRAANVVLGQVDKLFEKDRGK